MNPTSAKVVDLIQHRQSPKRDSLREIIKTRSFSEGDIKQLASGQASNFYFNMKKTMSLPEALNLIADIFLDEIDGLECDYVGGLEMGAVPILNAVTLKSFSREKKIPLFWIRKQAKEHGTRETVEGETLENLAGKTAVMVDDVTTTGGSVLRAIKEARKAGIKIEHVITLVDREEGARENLAKEDIKLISIFDASEFKSDS